MLSLVLRGVKHFTQRRRGRREKPAGNLVRFLCGLGAFAWKNNLTQSSLRRKGLRLCVIQNGRVQRSVHYSDLPTLERYVTKQILVLSLASFAIAAPGPS